MKKLITLVLVTSLISATAYSASFTDINGHWAKDSIITLAESGVVDGVTDTQFMPDGTITRAQYLKMIMEATGVKTADVREGECLDATVNDWYGVYLQSALDKGLIPKEMVKNYKAHVDYHVDDNGNATETKVSYTGEFEGNTPITREEMAVLTQYMYQYTRTILTNVDTDETDKKFVDKGEISDWAKQSVAQAVANGFMDGMDNNRFNPQQTATRAQSAVVVLRVLNKSN